MTDPTIGRLPPLTAAIHDLSCFGRCALTVILPTLSALGVQCVPLPTALLSSHTGGFEDLYFHDLTDRMKPIADHFSRLDLRFDALYSGFLGSEAQIGTVSDFFDRFGTRENLILVDPVMGDDGSLYATYTEGMMKGIRRLCRKADIITPNYTEACFLTDTPYLPTEDMDEESFLALCRTLAEKLEVYGASYTVLTGLFRRDRVVTLGKKKDGELFFHAVRRLPVSYPGTGDIFASVLLGRLLGGRDFREAVTNASDFTALTIEKTLAHGTPARNGVLLEACMRELTTL